MLKRVIVAFVIAVVSQESQAVQINNQLSSTVGTKTEQKWGFLKNIVNIDKFFDSGVKA